MKTNTIKDCTYEVPQNDYGIFALHCEDNQPIEAKSLASVLNGPIAAGEADYQAEISKPAKISE